MHTSHTFTQKRVIIHDAHIRSNATRLESLLATHGCALACATKALPLNHEFVTLFPQSASFYDVRLENLTFLNSLGRRTISHLQIDDAQHQCMLTDFEDIATLPNTRAGHYVFFDLGDAREGFSPSEAQAVISALATRSIHSVTIASNIGCLSENAPSDAYLKMLLSLYRAFTERGISVTSLSVGGSNCVPLIPSFASPVSTEVRVGEAILFGTYANTKSDLLHLNTGNIFLEAHRLKILSADEVLYDFGYTHCEPHELLPMRYEIIRQSANHTTLRSRIGARMPERIYLPVNYRGLTKLGQQRTIEFSFTSRNYGTATTAAPTTVSSRKVY